MKKLVLMAVLLACISFGAKAQTIHIWVDNRTCDYIDMNFSGYHSGTCSAILPSGSYQAVPNSTWVALNPSCDQLLAFTRSAAPTLDGIVFDLFNGNASCGTISQIQTPGLGCGFTTSTTIDNTAVPGCNYPAGCTAPGFRRVYQVSLVPSTKIITFCPVFPPIVPPPPPVAYDYELIIQ